MRTLVVLALLIVACHGLQRAQSHQSKHAQKLRGQVHNQKMQHKHSVKLLHNKAGQAVFRQLQKGFPSPISSDEYVGGDKASDDMKVFAPGFDTITEILNSLTQFDDNSATEYDEDRCGAAITVAASLLGGQARFGKLIDFLISHRSKPGRALPNAATLRQMKTKYASKQLTYGDLGKLEEAIYEGWSVLTGGEHAGMVGGQLYKLFVGMGIAAPSSTTWWDQIVWTEGQAWPYIIHVASDSDEPTAVHWILMGKTKRTASTPAVKFIYDPYTMLNTGPLYQAPNEDYVQYVDWITNDALEGSGFAPRTLSDATADITAEGF